MGGMYGPSPNEVGWAQLLGAIPLTEERRKDREFKEQQQQLQLETLRQQQQRMAAETRRWDEQAKRDALTNAMNNWKALAGVPWTPEIEQALGPLAGAAKESTPHPMSGTPIPSPMSGLPMGMMPEATQDSVRVPYDQVMQRQLMLEQARGVNQRAVQEMRNQAFMRLNDVRMKIAELQAAVANRRVDIASESVKVAWARLNQEKQRLEAQIAQADAQLQLGWVNAETNRMRADYGTGGGSSNDLDLMGLINGLGEGGSQSVTPASPAAPATPPSLQRRGLPSIPERTPLPGSPAAKGAGGGPTSLLTPEQRRRLLERIGKAPSSKP